jgi:hypothetical protein
MTASLIRARKPYLWKNFFMGIALSSLATGICACLFTQLCGRTPPVVYTIRAIGTDEFEDVKPAPRRKPQE